jgi:hypothetical protein
VRCIAGIFSLLTLLLAAGCAQAPKSISTEEPGTPKHLYEMKCGKCHRLYNPALYSADEWEHWFSKMSKRAHLKAEQTSAISGYIQEFLRPQAPQ